MVNDEELAAQVNALVRWFKSQNIAPEDSIPVLVTILAHAINHLRKGNAKPGGKIVGKMIVDLLSLDES